MEEFHLHILPTEIEILVNGKPCKNPVDLSAMKNRKIIDQYVVILKFKRTQSYIHTIDNTCSDGVIKFICECIFLSKTNLKSIDIPCHSCRILAGYVYLLDKIDKIDKFIDDLLPYTVYVNGKEFSSNDHLKLLNFKGKIYNIILKRPHSDGTHISVYDMVIPDSCLIIDGKIACELSIQCVTISLLREIAIQHNIDIN
jgi:hypothetical protein